MPATGNCFLSPRSTISSSQKRESESSPPQSDDVTNSCQVPSVRVQLVQSVKLPPNHSVVVEARLVGDAKLHEGPMLLEATHRLRNEMGLQLVDEFIQVTDTDASTKVLLTNSSGITQHVEMGTEIGIALPVDVIEPPPHPAQVLIPKSTDLPTLDPDEVLSGDNCSRTGVRVVTSTGQRNA